MSARQGSHRKRLKRDDASGDARFLTFSCFRRQPFLSKDRSRRWFLDALQRSRATHGFALWAYVIMPEHVHLLIWPGRTPAAVPDILYTMSKSVTNRALAYLRAHAPDFLRHMEDRQPNGLVALRFWQRGGGYDENIWRDAKLWEKIDYIHANPGRRGLCETPEDWPWSSARAFADYVEPPRRRVIGRSSSTPKMGNILGMGAVPLADARVPSIPIDFDSLPERPTRVIR